jgi:hypothetical protein
LTFDLEPLPAAGQDGAQRAAELGGHEEVDEEVGGGVDRPRDIRDVEADEENVVVGAIVHKLRLKQEHIAVTQVFQNTRYSLFIITRDSFLSSFLP